MRIALVSQEYPPETARGGIGTQTYLKAHGLAALGHEVQVISRSANGKRRSEAERGIPVLRVAGFERRLSLYTEAADWLTYSAEVAVALEEVHGQTPFDLVEFPEWGGEGYVYLLNRTEWNHIPTVIQLHGPLVMLAHTIGWPAVDSDFYRTGTMMEAACLRLADGVFSSSRCSAEWCSRRYGLEREKIPILHSGVDTDRFSPRWEAPGGRPTIVFAGKIVRNKGVEALVEAAASLAVEIPELRLRLIGRAEESFVEMLRRIASGHGARGLLEFRGFVPHEELAKEMAGADVFAAPSIYEGGPGFVYLEAMACGLPVIGCAGSGAAEVIRSGENGLLVAPDDPGSLLEALRRLLLDVQARTAMGRMARHFVESEADTEDCVRKLEAFYRAVVERHGRREVAR